MWLVLYVWEYTWHTSWWWLSDYPFVCSLLLCLVRFTANANVTRRGWTTQVPGIPIGWKEFVLAFGQRSKGTRKWWTDAVKRSITWLHAIENSRETWQTRMCHAGLWARVWTSGERNAMTGWMTGPKALSREHTKVIVKGSKASVTEHKSGVGWVGRKGYPACTLPLRHLSFSPHISQAGGLAMLLIHSGGPQYFYLFIHWWSGHY